MSRHRITIEVELADLPDEIRAEMADGLNFRADEDREIAPDLAAVPRVAELMDGDMLGVAASFFEGLEGYDMQAEIWAGSDVYGYFKDIRVVSVEPVKNGGAE